MYACEGTYLTKQKNARRHRKITNCRHLRCIRRRSVFVDRKKKTIVTKKKIEKFKAEQYNKRSRRGGVKISIDVDGIHKHSNVHSLLKNSRKDRSIYIYK